MAGPTRTQRYTGTPEQREAAYQADEAAAYVYGWVPLHREIDETSLRVTYHQPARDVPWTEPLPPSPPVSQQSTQMTPSGLEPSKGSRSAWIFGVVALVLVIGLAWAITAAQPQRGGGGTRVPLATPAQQPVVARCAPASRALMNQLVQGLDAGTGGGLRNGYTVKSGDYVKVWFIGAEITGEGIDPGEAVGIWATNDLNGSGVIYGIDGFAHSFSDWGDGTTTDAAMSMFDDGAQEAKACAGG